jgi:hypothetical protein
VCADAGAAPRASPGRGSLPTPDESVVAVTAAGRRPRAALPAAARFSLADRHRARPSITRVAVEPSEHAEAPAPGAVDERGRVDRRCRSTTNATSR